MNAVMHLIFQINNGLEDKTGEKVSYHLFSGFVPSAGIEPARLAALEFESLIAQLNFYKSENQIVVVS